MNKLAPFTQNQVAFFLRCQYGWFDVAEGGKRGGKNVLTTLAFCSQLENHKNKIHLVAGVSIATAKLNILDCDGYGLLNYFEGRSREGKYKNRDCLYIKTRTGEKVVLVSGGGKDGDYKLIKGNTYGMAYITEANECHPAFIKEVFDRTLSSDDRKIFHDLNPKAPNNWYYSDIIDFHEKKQEEDPSYGYNYGHFTIADNLSISDEKLAAVLATYDKKSIWYQRDILGLRCPGEGLIYDMWKDKYLFDDNDLVPVGAGYVAIDYGTTNPMAFLKIVDDGTTIWVTREYYWSSKKERRQKEDSEYADDYTAFVGDDPVMFAVLDPSALSFKVALNNRGYFVKGADNEVLEGLRRVSTMMARGQIRIHKRCTYLRNELLSYIWDEKATERGEEKPLKQSDHCLDALRYFVYTVVPKWRVSLIEQEE